MKISFMQIEKATFDMQLLFSKYIDTIQIKD